MLTVYGAAIIHGKRHTVFELFQFIEAMRKGYVDHKPDCTFFIMLSNEHLRFFKEGIIQLGSAV